MYKRLIRTLRTLAGRQEGLAYLEFAVTLPFLLLLFMGSVEVTRYIIIAQKVEKSAVTISDVVAQSETIGVTKLDQLITAVGEVMDPYPFGSEGYVIISSVTKTGTAAPKVNWQYKGGGTWVQTSQVGSTGGTATLPGGLTLDDKDTVIVAEIFYNYHPMMINDAIAAHSLYKVAVFKPRLGDLQTLGS